MLHHSRDIVVFHSQKILKYSIPLPLPLERAFFKSPYLTVQFQLFHPIVPATKKEVKVDNPSLTPIQRECLMNDSLAYSYPNTNFSLFQKSDETECSLELQVSPQRNAIHYRTDTPYRKQESLQLQ